jgi:hypothetical protein
VGCALTDTPEPAPTLRAAIAADWREGTARQRLALLGVGGWMAYEWGPGNETVTPWILVRVLRQSEGATAVVATAVVGLLFTAAQQLLSGFTALLGFSMFRRSSSAAWRRLSRDGRQPPGDWRRLGWAGRAALAFGLGTTAVALTQQVTTGDVGVRRHRGEVVQSALLCGALVAALGAAAGALAWLGREVERLRGGTDRAIDVLANPMVWLALAACVLLAGRLRR